MQTCLDIYRRFRIFRGLQEHQLRVAAVGKYVADRMRQPVDTRLVALAALFHDMGNLIKAIFSMPSLYDPEGVEYWQRVKEEFHSRYGDNEHVATREICHEIGLPEDVVALIDSMGFSKLEHTLTAGSLELKIIEYADMRVAPLGIVSLDQRLNEVYARYAEKMHEVGGNRDRFEYLLGKAHELEHQLVAASGFDPIAITDTSVASTIAELKTFQIV